jgi:tRNA (adenine-N(1)-)-methyltransferase non-catalytic subunit
MTASCPGQEAPPTTKQETQLKVSEATADGAHHKLDEAVPEGTHLKLGEAIPEGAKVPDSIMPAAGDDLAALAAHGFSSVLIAAPRFEPAAVLQHVQPLLQPSAALVVFSPSMQPLVECFHALQQTKEFISLQVCC